MYVSHTPLGDIEYRLEGIGDRVALLLYGGHTTAATRLGEEYFLERGYKVLAVSRPGYGNTPLTTGATPDAFANALAHLLRELSIAQVLVVGISAGGRTAMRFAAKHPAMTDKLILQSSISFAPWPDRLVRLISYIIFHPLIEKITWRFVRYFLKKHPKAAVTMMVANMTTLNPKNVVSRLSTKQLHDLTNLFAHMHSGRGFLSDIKTVDGDATDVAVPTLIIHSKYDKSVPLDHPRLLAQQIPNSRLYLSEAESHMIWFSPHYAEIKNVMDEFLRAQK